MKIRIAVAVLLVLIFSLLTVPTFFIRGLVKTYMNPSFYEGPVVEESYEYLFTFLKQKVSEDELISEYFIEEDIDKLVRKYFPPESLREIIQDFVSQMNNLSEGRKSSEIALSLLPLKQQIPEMAGDLSSTIIDKIPDCESELENFEDIIDEHELPECIPLEIGRSTFENPMKREIEKNLNDIIPGEFSLNLDNSESEGGAEFKQILFIFKYVEMMLPLFMLIILLFMALVIYKPYTRVIKFIGSSFLIGGILGFSGGQLFLQIPQAVILEKELTELINFYSFLIQFLVDKINIYSVWFAGLGILIILVGMYLTHFYEKQPHHDS